MVVVLKPMAVTEACATSALQIRMFTPLGPVVVAFSGALAVATPMKPSMKIPKSFTP